MYEEYEPHANQSPVPLLSIPNCPLTFLPSEQEAALRLFTPPQEPQEQSVSIKAHFSSLTLWSVYRDSSKVLRRCIWVPSTN